MIGLTILVIASLFCILLIIGCVCRDDESCRPIAPPRRQVICYGCGWEIAPGAQPPLHSYCRDCADQLQSLNPSALADPANTSPAAPAALPHNRPAAPAAPARMEVAQ